VLKAGVTFDVLVAGVLNAHLEASLTVDTTALSAGGTAAGEAQA